MEKTVPPLNARDGALRAIGRSLVNFQKLEHCLKILARAAPISTPLSVAESVVTKRVTETEKLTLGNAVRAWIDVTESCSIERRAAGDLPEPFVSISYDSLIDPTIIAEHSEALRTLATERNHLVHFQLADVDFESEEACRNLTDNLDKLNERILKQLAILAPAIAQIREMRNWVTSPEGSREIYEALTKELIKDDT